MMSCFRNVAVVLCACAAPVLAAQSVGTSPASDFVFAGTNYTLGITQYNPENDTSGFVAVLENGILIPGCTALKNWRILVDFESGARSDTNCTLPPSSTPGWRTIDVYAPATTTSPAASATFRLYTTAQPLPTRVQVSNPGPITNPNATAAFDLYAPAVPTYPESPDLTNFVRRSVPGTVTATIDGRTCVTEPYGSCSANLVAGGRHPVTATYHGSPLYLDSAISDYVVTVNPADDFNADGKADILWQNPAGRIAIWFMNGTTLSGAGDMFAAGSGFSIPLVGDQGTGWDTPGPGKIGDAAAKFVAIDRNGIPAVGGRYQGGSGVPKLATHFYGTGFSMDVVFDRPGQGVWTTNYPPYSSNPVQSDFQVAESGWHARLVADFDGNGVPDVVVQHDDGSVDMVMVARSSAGWGQAYPGARAHLISGGTGWVPSFTARFDYDGLNDILWTHPDGRTAIWIMAGTTQIGGALLLPAGTGFKPIWVADLNGDGRADIIWERASDGRTAFWLMDGTTQIGAAEIFPPNSGWKLLKMADYNGDGFPDYLAQHTDGRVAIGIFDGVRTFTQTVILPAGTGFSPIVTPQ